MLAQSLVEYGGLQGIGVGLQGLADSILYTVGTFPPGAWVIIGGVALGVLWLWGRRS